MASLLELIQEKSPLPFDQYMDLALYHPDFGYYAQHVDFGVRGDFITAPTLTPAFSHALGRFLLTHVELSAYALLELGPGNGQLAYDLLLFLDAAGSLPKRYYLVEKSARLKAQQQALLTRLPAHLFSLIDWVSLEDLAALDAIVLANEFFDALPVVRFTMTAQGVQEIYLKMQEGQLTEVLHLARPEVRDLIDPLNLPLGYTSEVCLAYPGLAQLLWRGVRRGLVLMIDYGYVAAEYFQPERHQGTLQAYYQHQALTNYLAHPGQMDLTAQVNFSHLSQAFLEAGFIFAFFTYQNVFLLEQGLEKNFADASPMMQQKIKRLVDPRLMGETFKVLAFSKDLALEYQPKHSLSRFL